MVVQCRPLQFKWDFFYFKQKSRLPMLASCDTRKRHKLPSNKIRLTCYHHTECLRRVCQRSLWARRGLFEARVVAHYRAEATSPPKLFF